MAGLKPNAHGVMQRPIGLGGVSLCLLAVLERVWTRSMMQFVQCICGCIQSVNTTAAAMKLDNVGLCSMLWTVVQQGMTQSGANFRQGNLSSSGLCSDSNVCNWNLYNRMLRLTSFPVLMINSLCMRKFQCSWGFVVCMNFSAWLQKSAPCSVDYFA